MLTELALNPFLHAAMPERGLLPAEMLSFGEAEKHPLLSYADLLAKLHNIDKPYIEKRDENCN